MMSSEEERNDDIGVLYLEKEFVSYAIRRIDETKAEGKISEKELDHLESEYRERMKKIEEAISRNESMVTLHELYKKQEDLGKQLSNLNQEIEEFESRIKIERDVSIPKELESRVKIKRDVYSPRLSETSEGPWIWSRKRKKE